MQILAVMSNGSFYDVTDNSVETLEQLNQERGVDNLVFIRYYDPSPAITDEDYKSE